MAKTIIEELIGIVGLEIDEAAFKKGSKALANVKNQYELVAKSATKLAVAGAALAGFTIITNKLTAEQENMAAAVGISGEALDALGGVAKQAGLNVDNVVDLVEELNNKFGESKGLGELTTPVKEAMQILGLQFDHLKNLGVEEQFSAILDAATSLEDAQAGSSAADILLGGEASKFISLLRQTGKSVDELKGDYIALSLTTKQNRKDAVEFNKSFGKLAAILGSGTKSLAAFLGKGLKPVIDFIVNWVAKNKELSQTIIKVFSIVLPAALAVAGIAVLAMTGKLILMGLAIIGVTAPMLGMAAVFALAAAWIGLVVEDIYTFVTAGDEAKTVTGALISKVGELWEIFSKSNIGEFLLFPINLTISAVEKLIELYGKLDKAFNVTDKLKSGFNFVADLAMGASGADSGGDLAGVGVGVGGASVNNNSSSNSSSVNTVNTTVNVSGMDAPQVEDFINRKNADAVKNNSTGFER